MWRANRIALWSLGGVLLSIASSSAAAGDRTFGSKPNIVFIFSDDQSYQTIAAHGFR